MDVYEEFQLSDRRWAKCLIDVRMVAKPDSGQLSTKSEVAIWFGLVMMLLVFVAAFFGFTPSPFILTTTKYAPGYSEKQFQQIQIGWTEQQVRTALGSPVYEFTNNNGYGQMLYAVQGSGFAMYFHSRLLVLSNGVVTEKISELNYDWARHHRRIGESVHILKLPSLRPVTYEQPLLSSHPLPPSLQ